MPKKKNTILIITEKPQAAEKIAVALSGAKDEKITNKSKVSYYEFEKGGKRVIVGCAVGHLFGIQQIAARGPFPNFEVEWQPAYKRKNSTFTKKYYDVLKKLVKEADEFIVATDYDVEGEVIGWNVVRFIAKQKDAKRMKFSSLTKDELEKAFENPQPTLEWGAAMAGETRHYIDWFYGINLSRGLMKALSTTGKFRILSIGRIQGPALKIIVDRELEIKNFEPETYWQIFLQVRDVKRQKIEVKYPKDLKKESELAKFKILKEKKGIASTEIKKEKISPPVPFDLTTLQTECYKLFGLTPSQTLKIAQNLYLAGVISYPRTSSQKYPKEIGYNKILKQLKKHTQLVKYAVNKKPIEGKKLDPAHPAIYPTGESKKKIGEQERKIYDLIVKRFISCFCKEAEVENKKVVVDVSGLKFNAKGLEIKEKNWINVYPSNLKEEKIPTINGEVDVQEIRTEEKQTKPPRRYSPASLVRELEKRNLGTKATRASIVETLYSRGYVQEKSMEATELGIKMENTLNKYAPKILDEQLTREMEGELEKLQTAKKDLDKKEKKILEKAKKEVSKIAKEITQNLEEIGKDLEQGSSAVYEKERQASTMTKCPNCGKGNLRIMYGRKFKRYFVSCDAYPKCKTIFSLPPNGKMIPARNKEGEIEKCEECDFPLVVSFKKGKRPWKFCFNPECKTNEEWVKKKEEFKAGLKKGKAEANN
jgi:DNA topoisomerase-1